MKLGIDFFSLRWQGWDAFQFLEYAAKMGLDNVHYSERELLDPLGDTGLVDLKRRSDELGLHLEVGMKSFDQYSQHFNAALGSGEEQLIFMAKRAHLVGSPVVRCLLGGPAERTGPISFQQHVEECIRTLRAAAPVAGELGVRFAVENHHVVDFLARELRALIEAVGPDIVGACLDTGNPVYAGEDPVLSAEVLAPYVLTSHFRDSRVWAVDDGAMAQWTPMGQGYIDLGRIVNILSEQAPHAPVDLEILTGALPWHIPYLNPKSDYWKAFPDMPARDFARYIALVQQGKPAPLSQVTAPLGTRGIPPGELGEQLKAQQLRHFEQSVKYCREVLGLGERGR